MIRKKTQQKKQTTRLNHSSETPQELTFLEHIRELRARVFWVIASLLIASSIAFVFKDTLVHFILAPLHGEKLVYLTIGGGFSFIFTVCLYFGLVMSVPVIVYHLYQFLQPVLGKTSRRLIVTLILSSAGLALTGAAFGYFVAIQASINFLMGFAEGAITSSVTADSYMNFIVAYTAGLAIVFQLPLLLFMFDHIRPFPPGALLNSQRFVITGAVIVAALITPTPDVVNQMIIAVPIVAIYELGAALVYVRRKMRQRKKVSVVAPVKKEQEGERTVVLVPEIIASATSSPIPAVVPPNRAVHNPQSKKPVSIQKSTVPQKIPRSVDGFARKSSPHVIVPQRQGVSTSTTQHPTRLGVPAGRRVSIDGFSLV